MEVKPGYKQTEVGVIPEDWEVGFIGQLFKLINGFAFKPEDWKQNGTPIIRIQNLNDSSASFNFSQLPIPEKIRVEPGDLLFAWSGTVGTSFGARIWRGPSGVLNQHIFKVIIDDKRIDLSFSLIVFARIEEDIAKQAHGFKASFLHVKKSDLVKVKLPLPSLPEQRAIATALSDMDALLDGLDRLITKKRAIKQAAMQQLLTGQTRLPGFSGEWEVKTLGQIAQLKSGYAFKSDNYDPLGNFKIITIANVQDGFMDIAECSRITSPPSDLQPHQRLGIGQILISMTGNVGRVCRVTEHGCLLNQRVGVLVPICISADILFFLLSQRLFVRAMVAKAKGGAQGNLSIADITEFEFVVPQTTEEQTAIATVLNDMDTEITALETRRTKTRALKQAMMQELLTGRTRLI